MRETLGVCFDEGELMGGLSDALSAAKRFLVGDSENPSPVFAAVRGLGVADPKNPSAGDFKVIWDAYLKDKSLNTDVFTAYVKSLSVPLKSMFDGFAQFSADTREVSKHSIGVIERAMEILQRELDRVDITEDERQQALERVLHLVAEARDESEKERTFRARLAYGMLAVVAIVGGIAVWIITGGKYRGLLEKGMDIAAKAA